MNDMQQSLVTDLTVDSKVDHAVISKVVTITPSLAAEYLKNNKNNRPIRNGHVKFLADQMRNGQWVLNGAPIIFVGRALIDGQHRLSAIIKSGRPVSVLVVRMPLSVQARHVFDTIDQNVVRDGKDVLAIRGEVNCSTLATILRELHSYDKGIEQRCRYSNRQILEFLETYPDARESAFFASTNNKKSGSALMTRGQWGFFHYVLSRIDKDDALDFLTKLLIGADISVGHPVHTLRNHLFKLQINFKESTSLGMRSPKLRELVFQTWNAYRNGARMLKFQVKKEDSVRTLPH